MKAIPYQSASGITIKDSKGKGRGVFATRRYRAGEVIESVPALVVPKTEVNTLSETFLGHYMFTTDNKKNLVLGLGATSMLNHDDDANAEFFVTIDTITIKAKRAIVSGSEITINYGWREKEWAMIGVKLVMIALSCALCFFHTEAFSQASQSTLNDGPYVSWNADGSVKVDQVCAGKAIKKSYKATESFGLYDACTGAFVSNVYRTLKPQADSFTGVDTFFAVSDVEGHLEGILTLLQANGIIDSELKWSFGKGHLLFLGDMVDRGDHVTEVLWLIHRLEREASEDGGAVHYVLGNHEKMVFEGDNRYLNEKYSRSTKVLGSTYQELYSNASELGRWMRSHNSLVRINDTLFVHAGLSPALIAYDLSLSDINAGIRKGLIDPSAKSDTTIKYLLSSDGPLWYRGYFKDESLTDAVVKSGLDPFAAARVVVGHTIQDEVGFYHDKRVIALDTSFASLETIQGLLFKDGHFWRAKLDGRNEAL